MLCKSLIQFSIYGWSCVPSLLFTWPNYAGGDEDDGDLLQKISCMNFYTQCPQSCSRPPLTHASTGDSWTVTGKSGPVSCEVTTPFSGVLVHARFCLCSPRVYFPVLCKFCTQYAKKFGKLSSGHRTGKVQFSFQSQRKAMPKNAQTTTQLHLSHMLVK